MKALERIGDLLRAAHLDPALIAPEAIQGIVDERRRATGAPTLDAYADFALRSSDEFARLREQIAVPETWLFRYPASFDLLRQRLARRVGRPFRALSVACATGAEAYSIAATALAAGLNPGDVHVLGIDPNPSALERARTAELGRMAVRGGLPDWATGWITATPTSARIAPILRSVIEFREGAAPEALDVLPPRSFDAVFCRNLAIYLSDAGRRTIGARLERLLADDGMLFLGHAERPALFGLEQAFEPAEPGFPGTFASVRRSAPAPTASSLEALPADAAGAGKAAAAAPRRSRPAPPTPPSTAATARIDVPNASRTPAVRAAPVIQTIEDARAAADAGDLRRAAAIAERLRTEGDRSIELSELTGSVYLALGDDARAESALREVAYLDPTPVEALLQLGILAERRGDSELAARYRFRAAKGGRA